MNYSINSDTIYPIIKKNREEYVVDIDTTLTSNPPQYNAYRLIDRQHTYVFCYEVNLGNKVMYGNDFRDFMYGKFDKTLTLPSNGMVTGTLIANTTISSEVPTPIVHVRPKTADERIDELEKEIKKLHRLIGKLTKA